MFRCCVCLGIIDIGIVCYLCSVYLLVCWVEMVFFHGIMTNSMLHEWQTVCYMKDRRYATWRTVSMLHEWQMVCYMNDRWCAIWKTESVLPMMVSEPTDMKDLASCWMPYVIGWVIPDVSCKHRALVLGVSQLVILDCLNLKTKALCFFGPSGTTHSVTQYNIPEDLNHQHHCCESPKSWYKNLSKKAINIVQISYMYSQEC